MNLWIWYVTTLCIINYRNNRNLCQVLRLTDSLPIDATQLERQADLISVLTAQCDFLVRQAEEDRDRWRSEREGWDRMAEALLSHRNKSGKSATREDVCFSSFSCQLKVFTRYFLRRRIARKHNWNRRTVPCETKYVFVILTHPLSTFSVKTLNFISLSPHSYKILRIDYLP